ncbi:hypothetical protein DSO57_1023298 [Entomophthora muscae]|uniref:Uncharacterized protein n=1 Tax=Entomophthora muscae TaxID=34485 RepID=A0ACC2T322_9FUNG|nr:hypothetical protein DSO57_1023298 [Entomophthora muscae]
MKSTFVLFVLTLVQGYAIQKTEENINKDLKELLDKLERLENREVDLFSDAYEKLQDGAKPKLIAKLKEEKRDLDQQAIDLNKKIKELTEIQKSKLQDTPIEEESTWSWITGALKDVILRPSSESDTIYKQKPISDDHQGGKYQYLH